MKDKFDWQIGDPDEEVESINSSTPSGRLVNSFMFVLAAALITGLVVGGWRAAQSQLAQSEQRLKQRVQMLLDLESTAFAMGDGELFFSTQIDDPAWLSAQLQPQNQTVYRSGAPQVTRVQPHGDVLWANISWVEGGESWQRITFFAWQDDRLTHVDTDPSYWGSRLQLKTSWGELAYHQVDDPWIATVDTLVESTVNAACQAGCPPERRPIRLELTPDYSSTAQANHLRMPSPRLWALGEDGRPAPPFWQELQRRIENHLQPAAIRFAVPPIRIGSEQLTIDYEHAARVFMERYPEIHLDLVMLEAMPADPSTLALEFDGVAMPPTEEMLAAGLVRDLTDYVNTDAAFEETDFYEQLWQGALWQDRIWFMPQAALMNLVFYDKAAYRMAAIPEPTLRWTWEEMTSDIESLLAARPANADVTWGFLDTELDSLYSYAYNWHNPCPDAPTIYCLNQLEPENISAALTWYQEMAQQADYLPDLSGLNRDERTFFMWNTQTTRRKVPIWVDRPSNYEHQLLIKSLGVVPFPGSDRFDGITPLWMQGSFISQSSQQPLAVWQWLKFLSYQRPAPRLVPARPSVAQQMGFWTYLPRPLGNAMRTAFSFARPIRIAEASLLSWPQIEALISGELTVEQAVLKAPGTKWFLRID